MSKSSFIAGLIGATALVGLSALGVQAQTSGEPVKIGAIVSVTGAGAGLGSERPECLVSLVHSA